MANIRKKFAQNLKKCREAKKMSQERLAEKLGINVRYVQQLEGKNTPDVKLETLASLAKALGVTPADLIR